MWLYSVCQHIPGVTECEQTQVESCREIVNKLGKDLHVSHLWLYTPWYFGQIAQSLHAYFPPLNRNIRIFFACLTYSCYNPPGKEVVIILCLQNTQYGKAPGPKCCTGVSNNETQTVLCFSLHSTGHNTGNNICLLPLSGENSPFFLQRLYQDGKLSWWKACLSGRKARLYPIPEPNHQYLMDEPVSLGCGELQELTHRSVQGAARGLSQDSKSRGRKCFTRLVFRRDNKHSLPPDWEGCNLLHREEKDHLLACQQHGDRWSFMH